MINFAILFSFSFLTYISFGLIFDKGSFDQIFNLSSCGLIMNE